MSQRILTGLVENVGVLKVGSQLVNINTEILTMSSYIATIVRDQPHNFPIKQSLVNKMNDFKIRWKLLNPVRHELEYLAPCPCPCYLCPNARCEQVLCVLDPVLTSALCTVTHVQSE